MHPVIKGGNMIAQNRIGRNAFTRKPRPKINQHQSYARQLSATFFNNLK